MEMNDVVENFLTINENKMEEKSKKIYYIVSIGIQWKSTMMQWE